MRLCHGGGKALAFLFQFLSGLVPVEAPRYLQVRADLPWAAHSQETVFAAVNGSLAGGQSAGPCAGAWGEAGKAAVGSRRHPIPLLFFKTDVFLY